MAARSDVAGAPRTDRISGAVRPAGRVVLGARSGSPAAPGGFGADRIDRDRAAQDVPEVLEGQGGRPGQQHRGIQAPAADGGQGERAHNDGTGGESGSVRGEVAAALDAGGQVDDLLAGMHGLLLTG